MVREARADRGIDIEMRFVSIPDSGAEPATEGLFNKPYMLDRQELGRAMGADTSSWQTALPSVFSAKANAGE